MLLIMMKLHRYNKVDNVKFYNQFVEQPKDGFVVTDYMAECFINIGVGLSHSKNFQGYTYRDEMILDGIEQCIKYCRNFNPKKSKNPFSYFTQITKNSFLRRMEKEKKQQYIVAKLNSIKYDTPDPEWVVEWEIKMKVRLEKQRERGSGLHKFFKEKSGFLLTSS